VQRLNNLQRPTWRLIVQSAESEDAEIAAEGASVIVTWWEKNENVPPHAEEHVARISTDNGATFGPTLMLATNGTIGSEEETATEEEE
jgi:alkanesulfonate monooxygenase SsuD/methylene tetrahydromethanopterin reductase-like flavin-dependent oxidoreductase (luciferase family)